MTRPSIRRIRRLGWKPDLPDQRDFALVLPKKLVPKRVDLRATLAGRPVYDQGNLGSCTANAVGAAIQFLEAKEGALDKTPTQPSRLFIYYGERVIEGSTSSDAGAEIRDGMKVVAKLGYPDESLWPYKVGRFAVKPPATVYAAALKDRVTAYYRVSQAVQSMRLCLAHGFPFVFGISVYDSFESPEADATGDIPLPASSEGLLGGHALLCVGYDDSTKRFRFRNSWGPGWGDGGYGTIPYAYLADPNLGSDYWTVRRETTA